MAETQRIDETTQAVDTATQSPFKVPQTMEFPNDPEGYRKTIYEIIFENDSNGHPELRSETIAEEFAVKVSDGIIDLIPQSPQQIAAHLSAMETELTRRGLSIVMCDEWKDRGTTRKAFKYKLHILGETPSTITATEIGKIEDTEIDKHKYITSIKSQIPPRFYQMISILATRGQMTRQQIVDAISIENIEEMMDELNKTGASPRLPQKFMVVTEKRGKSALLNAYRLVIFKPLTQKKSIQTDEPKIIDELAATDTRSPFAIKRKIQALIKEVLSEADKLEMASKSKDEITVLRTRREISKMILTRIKDILHTLDVMAQKSEMPRITDTIKDQLNSVLKSHEASAGKELSPALRAKLGVISRT